MTNGGDPSTFLNQYLPLRLHPKVKDIIDDTIKRFKPSKSLFFGLLLSNRTVVGLIKNDPKI